MSAERSQCRVIQNGNPFEDARIRLAPQCVHTVIDVGANVGDICQHLMANFPEAHVHAFEPAAGCFAELARRYRDAPNVTCLPVGLSNRRVRQLLYEYEESGLNALSTLTEDCGEFLAGYGVAAAGKHEVDLITLDDYCQQEELTQIEFLKLDVQGWELNVLRGAQDMLSAGRIKAIYTEVGFVRLYDEQVFYEDVAQFLRKFGFGLFSLYALSFNEHKQLCWADALFLPVTRPTNHGAESRR